MLISYSHSDFFCTRILLHNEFNNLVADCFKKKGTICFSIENNMINVKVNTQEQPLDSILVYISNNNSIVELLQKPMGKGVQLLLPLLVDFESIHIPYHQIFLLCRDKRSIGDFCARNLFYAICRTSNISFKISLLSPSISNFSRDISKCYLWVLCSMINDPFLKKKGIRDKIVINFYFKIVGFENNLLESGFEEIRNYYLNNSLDSKITQCEQFMQLRDKIMTCL